jgi:hypothetical protein
MIWQGRGSTGRFLRFFRCVVSSLIGAAPIRCLIEIWSSMTFFEKLFRAISDRYLNRKMTEEQINNRHIYKDEETI